MDRHRPCVPAGIRAAADLPAAEQVNVVHGYGHIPSGTARSLTGIGYNPSYPGAATAVDGQGGICADTGHLNLASIAGAGRAAVDHALVAQINVVHGYGHIPRGPARSRCGNGQNPGCLDDGTAVDRERRIRTSTCHLNLASVTGPERAATDLTLVAQINRVGRDGDRTSFAAAAGIGIGGEDAGRGIGAAGTIGG